jgi:choline dehydrogenase
MILTSSTSTTEAFDYVIVGAGSAGCVLANRLSADPTVRVLLLEAGPQDGAEAIRIPVLAPTLWGSEVDWDYQLDTQEHYYGSTQYPRGKTLGGSSSINIMVYIRGHRSDFDGWAQRGCAGWDYDSVLPYFMKAECNSRLSAPLHGTDGPQHVEDRLFTHEMSNAWIDAADAWGLKRTDDFNGDTQLGAGSYQVTCHKGWRWSAADAYLRPALGRANLVVRVNSHTTRILFDGNRAVGVTYLHDGQTVIADAEREVILSAGAINSPQLLLLSGVGPADQLRADHIEVIADLPGVGHNLHDHTMTPMVWATKGSTDLLQMIDNDSVASWQNHQGGPLASNGAEVGAFVSLTTDTNVPDIQFMCAPTSVVDHGRLSPPPANFTVLVACTHPQSRGRLALRSADPLAHPYIDPAYFSDPADLEVIKAGMRVANEIAQQSTLAKHLDGLRLPQSTIVDDDTLAHHTRRFSQTVYHPVGTCAMGTDPAAVVDPTLTVRGTEALRVIDASVMPTIISGNTNAATIMIAEKAADLITVSDI